jgi:hypothetical protein
MGINWFARLSDASTVPMKTEPDDQHSKKVAQEFAHLTRFPAIPIFILSSKED